MQYENSQNKPHLSVFMVTYNQVNLLAKALDGVLSQNTVFDYEVVIGDDCSTDGTRELLEEYYSRYPNKLKLILNSKNVGPEKNARNVLRNCNGMYIALCDGDDFWHDSNKLQKQLEAFLNNKDAVLIHSDYNIIKGNNIKKFVNTKYVSHYLSGNLFEKLLSPDFPMICTSTVIFKNGIVDFEAIYSTIESNGWLLGDLVLWLELSLKGDFIYMNESTSTYRLLDESASRSNNFEKMLAFHKSVYDIKFYYWEKYSNDLILKNQIENSFFNTMIGDAFRIGSKTLMDQTIDEMKKLGIKLTLKQLFKYLLVTFNYQIKALLG